MGIDEKEPTSMLTELQSCIDGVFNGLKLPAETTRLEKLELVRVLFEQSQLTNRTNLIQGFKKQNIRDIRK